MDALTVSNWLLILSIFTHNTLIWWRNSQEPVYWRSLKLLVEEQGEGYIDYILSKALGQTLSLLTDDLESSSDEESSSDDEEHETSDDSSDDASGGDEILDGEPVKDYVSGGQDREYPATSMVQ